MCKKNTKTSHAKAPGIKAFYVARKAMLAYAAELSSLTQQLSFVERFQEALATQFDKGLCDGPPRQLTNSDGSLD